MFENVFGYKTKLFEYDKNFVIRKGLNGLIKNAYLKGKNRIFFHS